MKRLTLELADAVLADVQAEARRDEEIVGDWIARAVAEKLMRRQAVDARIVAAQVCRGCDRQRKHYARGLCRTCYDRGRDPAVRWSRVSRPLRICKACQENRPHEARGLCQRCYERARARKGAA